MTSLAIVISVCSTVTTYADYFCKGSITMTSWWVWWRLKSPASRLLTQMFIQTQIKEKHQSSASLAFVRGIHRWSVNSPNKWPVTRNFSHLMTSSWICASRNCFGLPPDATHGTFWSVSLGEWMIGREKLLNHDDVIPCFQTLSTLIALYKCIASDVIAMIMLRFVL